MANSKARTIRMLSKADSVGFGLSHICLAAGGETNLWHKHYWQTNHIISGFGKVTDLTNEQAWKLEPGTAYNVGPDDHHQVCAHTDIVLLSVWPPTA